MYTAGDQELIRIFNDGIDFIGSYQNIFEREVFSKALKSVYRLSEKILSEVDEDRELYDAANMFSTAYLNIGRVRHDGSSATASKIDGKSFRFKISAAQFLEDYGFEKKKIYWVKGDQMFKIEDGDDEYIIRDALK